MLKTILVDDEPIILEDFKELISSNSDVEVVGMYQNPLEALEELEKTKPNCAFLDIEMTEMKGIELANRLISEIPEIEIVFVTAYNNYAAQAYDVNAIDYLLKPIRAERLARTVEKIIEKIGVERFNADKTCKIKCFGAFEVLVGGQSVKWGRSKSKEFLAYMLQNEGKWISKYKLCDELRLDEYQDQALAYLQTAVYTLRKNLKAAGCNQLEIKYSDDRYILYAKNVDWDLKNFAVAYKDYKRAGTKEILQNTLKLCKEEYLEGEDWLWADLEREFYRSQYEQFISG